MKLSRLESKGEELLNTVFKDHKHMVGVEIGLKCLVVGIKADHWSGPLVSEIDGIPITYIFNANFALSRPK